MFCPTEKAKGTNLCRRVNIGKQIEQIAKLFIIEFVPTTRHSEIDCFCCHKKRMLLYHDCWCQREQNEIHFNYAECSPTCASQTYGNILYA